jgi:hypothetical protein
MAAPEDSDLELIAAFIDGKLAGSERERVVKLLGESEPAFEIYADAVRTLGDIGQAGSDSVVSLEDRRNQKRRTSRWWIAAPAAAAAVLLLAVMPMMRDRRGVSGLELPTQAMLEPLKGQAGVATALRVQLEQPSWSVTRGGRTVGVDSTTALRLGVRVTDLQAALDLGDRERASRVATEIIGLVGPLSVTEASVAEYEAIRARLASGDSIGQVSAAATSAENNLQPLLKSRWFGFGKWYGAGELAALAHSASFFSDPHTREFLDSAIERGRLAPEDVELLRQVAEIAKRGVADADFATVRQKFAELIRRHGG